MKEEKKTLRGTHLLDVVMTGQPYLDDNESAPALESSAPQMHNFVDPTGLMEPGLLEFRKQ